MESSRGDRANDPYNAPVTASCWISSDFFRAIGTPLLEGRTFTVRDNAQASPVVVINSAMAQKYWPGQNPIGKRLAVNYVGSGRQNTTALRFREIAGVVANIKQKGLDLPSEPALYTPFLQDETNHDFTAMYVFVRTAADPRSLATAIRTQVHMVRSDQPVDLIRTMDDVLFQSLAPRRFGVALLGSFAALALLLSAVGIYGMVAYSVSQRTQELGLRMALGARSGDLVAMVMKEGLLLTGIGIVLGLSISPALTRTTSALLFEVTPTDLPTFAGAVGLLFAVSALGCVVPPLRAGRIDPMTTLREE